MLGMNADRSMGVKLLSALCVLLAFVMGIAQAVHSHPNGSVATHHSCSICSTPSVSLITATPDATPALRVVALATVAGETAQAFQPASAILIRPPPAF